MWESGTTYCKRGNELQITWCGRRYNLCCGWDLWSGVWYSVCTEVDSLGVEKGTLGFSLPWLDLTCNAAEAVAPCWLAPLLWGYYAGGLESFPEGSKWVKGEGGRDRGIEVWGRGVWGGNFRPMHADKTHFKCSHDSLFLNGADTTVLLTVLVFVL